MDTGRRNKRDSAVLRRQNGNRSLGVACRVLGATAATVLAFSFAACGDSGTAGSDATTSAGGGDEVSGKVYYLTPGPAQAERYLNIDAPNMKDAFEKLAPGIEFQALDSHNSTATQLAQAENAISNGARAIILSSVDGNQAAAILAKAAAARVPVISYAPEAFGGPLYARVSVPFVQIGQDQARYFVEHLPRTEGPVRLALMYGDPAQDFYKELKKGFDEYLDPVIADGRVSVVCRGDAIDWDPANAQRNMEQCLTKTNNGVDAALVMNDGTGTGVMAAISRAGVADRVKLYGGYDATIEGVQRVLAGKQAADMTADYALMARTAAELAITGIRGEEPPRPPINGVFDSRFSDSVPAAYLPNTFVTADNVQETIVDTGIYDKATICTGEARSSSFCRR
ncbi:substrate-binding domain-containing protein [Conexibacter stalactiti]|uniref:Substrate-binding domain-containing protein n=1 Tax=Conexibacter stalactiti TaxID=1940611 RepID=A0ABU4HID7_9ACTN|nr:substrate-binding domain-containing protein [Conexibacter stalactiti]MDW5593078.1 substrate-binding domain-containing protein [Conexibacter stalactiti]MEC5033719.1 substrate-binding domain-containing protein [Conexibacter stalactiti]